jgi:hypothetical protein
MLCNVAKFGINTINHIKIIKPAEKTGFKMAQSNIYKEESRRKKFRQISL